jgi:hypothetical protein
MSGLQSVININKNTFKAKKIAALANPRRKT